MNAANPSEVAGSARISASDVELILSQVESLPTLPAVAGRLLEMTMDNETGTGEIAALIESDQSLSARVLSVVRKSNLGSDVQTVDRAVVMLGCDIVRSVVLGVQVFELFQHQCEPSAGAFDRTAFWRHSLAVGCAARLIADKRMAELGRTRAARMGWPIAKPEEAFVCGLLHDLGKVVLDSCFPKSYDRVIERVESRRADIADVERELFGIDHTIAGHRLARFWKLPAAVAECIWLHHQSPESTPTRIGYPDHVMLVQAADRLARQMHIGYSGNHAADGTARELAASVGLSSEDLEAVMLALPEAIEARAELLGLQEVTSRELMRETLVRTNSELARVNTALTMANRTLEQRSRALDAICALNESLGEDHRHEAVAAAVAAAFQTLFASNPVAVLVSSPARQLMMIAVLAPGESQARLEILPNAAAGDLQRLRERSGRAAPETVLPGPLLDRLMVLFGRLPQYCRSIRCPGGLALAICAAQAVPEDLDRSVELIGADAASWLKSAESTFVNHQLTEEMAEINRRLVKTQAEVARMRSLGTISEMAAGAAHELNNPLAVISGRGQLLSRDYGDDVTKSARIIIEHAHRASSIVNELMEFAKPAPAKPTVWRLPDLLVEVRRGWLEKKALTPEQFTLDLSDDLPAVRADASQIRILFDEVIRNAVEALQGRDNPRLTVNCHADVADDRLVIRIEDNGCGMTPEVAERAFDPFFSHRPAGRGRGLGLSRAARYAQINHGSIRLSSRVKEGTAVYVELPAAVAE